ncbi:Diels-Alderase ccsF [Metarhizium anisopliae]|nr:Diels-Alderase ccsF [Metarhizium anisopliae]
MTAFEMAKAEKSFDFTTKAMGSLEEPKIPLLNSSAGEQWEFDGVSDDGMQSFVFGFYRDAKLRHPRLRELPSFHRIWLCRPHTLLRGVLPQRSVVETCHTEPRSVDR